MYHAPRAMSPTKQSTRGSLASLPSFGRFLTCSTPPNHVVKRLPPSTPIVDCLAPFNPFLTVVGSPKPTLDASPCVYDNCDKFAKINKLCLGHFRLITSSAATPRQPIHPVSPALSAVDRPKYANRRCKHLGCSKYGLAGGFCISHGGGKKCLDDGCDTTAQSGGYCKSHGGGSRCRFENCPRIAKRKGVCKEHGGRHLCKHSNGRVSRLLKSDMPIVDGGTEAMKCREYIDVAVSMVQDAIDHRKDWMEDARHDHGGWKLTVNKRNMQVFRHRSTPTLGNANMIRNSHQTASSQGGDSSSHASASSLYTFLTVGYLNTTIDELHTALFATTSVDDQIMHSLLLEKEYVTSHVLQTLSDMAPLSLDPHLPAYCGVKYIKIRMPASQFGLHPREAVYLEYLTLREDNTLARVVYSIDNYLPLVKDHHRAVLRDVWLFMPAPNGKIQVVAKTFHDMQGSAPKILGDQSALSFWRVYEKLTSLSYIRRLLSAAGTMGNGRGSVSDLARSLPITRESYHRPTNFGHRCAIDPCDELEAPIVLRPIRGGGRIIYNTPMDDDTVQNILDCKGSSCPLYLRLVLTMFDQGHHHHLSDHFQSVILHASDFPSLYEAILLTDLVEAVDHLTRKPAPAASDSSPQLDRPDSRKRNSRRESEHMTQMASQLSPEDDEMNRINVQMERRALLARHALSLFTVSRFGLSEKDFHHLLEDAAPRPIRTLLLQLLMPHLMAIHRKDSDSVLYDISHNQLRLLVRYGFLHDDGLRHGYHKAIASYCEKMPTCQRRIDELPVQLECCGMWSQLQSCLVEMKMFQLWWHERNRQDFLAYWKTLRSYFSTHDPVDDYIRSLDEYIEVEGPSTEQLLSLFLTRSDVKVKPDIHMHRPDPPQLKEFINSQGTFSLSHLTDVESKQIQGIVDYLCPHPDDGYFVRRWLWTQFPLIAVSFENLFLKKFTSEALAAWSGVGELDGGGSVSSSSSPPDKKDKSCSTTPAATSSSPHAATSTTSGSSYKSNHSILPKSVGAVVGDRKRVIARHSPKKNSQHVLELLNPEVSGAFEFGDAAGDISLSIPALRVDLRARYDKLKFISKERQDALATLESKVNDAKANTSHQNQNSRLRDELLEQIRITMLDSTHGRQKSDYYKSILRQCETNPARDPNIIESSEMNVRKMKQDITDLQQKAQVIGYERRLAAIEIPKLTTAIEEKLQIHQVALSRLRWRQLQHLRQMEWETKFRIRSKEMKKQAEGDLSSAQEEAMVVRLKEKVEHKQEANSMRVKNLQDLKVYKGSQFMDDGLLGVLPGEERVAACRQELEALRHELQNLKLGQTTVKPGKAPPPSTGNGKPSTSGSASDTTAMNDGGSKHHNIKQVELQLADATAILHQKKQRAIRLKALSENLHLGLLHLAVMLGVKASQGMDSIMLADAAEHSVRSLIGEEGGSGTSTNLGSLRKKNSMRKGITQTQAPVQRSQEEIQRYNLRVRTAVSPTKRFAGVECTAADDTDAFPESDDSDASGNDEEAVRDRADIKASSVLEVQNQTGGKRPARRRGKKKPTGSPSGQASAAGAVAATE
ncbi:hypothetical protein DYB32_004788 [Aphanomyces invadans]|uniref:WRKY19-like zinc finger domain-containing protein n=1 Tax=Aphanomyces invadans TaxID=157072 RepID=A0A3R6YZ64_9STRA|nr:hypothetical protein DYB32_004788 [Aphanomyces invadans]